MEIDIQKACPICHRYNNCGENCLSCEKQSFLDSHLAIMKYEEEKLIGELVHNFKYNYAEDIFGVFEKIISDFLSQNIYYFENIDFIIPVPLHGRRFAERGFNQAELIANAIAKLTGKEVRSKAIVRQRYTSVQARLNKEERTHNVSGAFVMSGESAVKNKNILIVDDVFTTGSTLQECAKLLKYSGAKKISGFTLARG